MNYYIKVTEDNAKEAEKVFRFWAINAEIKPEYFDFQSNPRPRYVYSTEGGTGFYYLASAQASVLTEDSSYIELVAKDLSYEEFYQKICDMSERARDIFVKVVERLEPTCPLVFKCKKPVPNVFKKVKFENNCVIVPYSSVAYEASYGSTYWFVMPSKIFFDVDEFESWCEAMIRIHTKQE